MKISKAKLRQIIKEELAEAEEAAPSSLRESAGRLKATDDFIAAIEAALLSKLDHEDLRDILEDYLAADRLKWPAGR